MGSCAAPSAKGDDKFITTDYLQQCLVGYDSEVKKVLIYDSMNTSPEWQSNIDVYDKLTLAFNDKYKNEDCSICGLYYDGVYEPKPLHSSSWKDWCTIL